MREKNQQSIDRFDEKYSVEEVLSLVPDDITVRERGEEKRKTKRQIFHDHPIKFKSLRLLTFKKKGIACLHCGIKGVFFVKEKHGENGPYYHLNLYALNENDKEVLMTKDHIISKSKGGRNNINNMQTLCTICNCLKN